MKKSELINNDFKFNKQFGQNFIFDKNLLQAIVKDSQITTQDEVLEIGAGAGTLTNIIALNAKYVVSYEIDTSLKQILNENLKNVKNCKVIFADALKTPLTEIEKNFTNNYTIVANIPYYITTPLIFKFVGKTNKVKSMNIMVQKEVGERLIATAQNGDYGSISAILNFYADVKILRQVPRHIFTPIPKVDSCIVQINFIKDKFDCDATLFEKVVKSGFSNKRKTLVNNISKDFNIKKDVLINLLKELNYDENIRADNLNTSDFVLISKKLCKI